MGENSTRDFSNDISVAMEKEVKKLRSTLLFLLQKDGLKERKVKHTKSDEVAVEDILSHEHFSHFNLDHFYAAVARNNHDKKLKEEPRFLLIEDSDRRLTVKYFPDGIDYQESEIKENVETQENFSTDQNSTRNDENEDEVVEDTKEDGLITGGQRKKNKKKSKGKNKALSEASDEKNSAVKELGESSSKAVKDAETAADDQFKPVQTKGKRAKEDQKQCEETDKDISGECGKETEQERSSLKPPGDEEQSEAMNCTPQSVSPLPADEICASASGTPPKKKGKQSGTADSQHKENQSKQKKGAGKQTEANETKNAAKESKQREEGKQSENEPTKKDEKRGQNAKKADTPSKANEPTKKSPEKKQTKETNDVKKRDAAAGTEADSSDDEKSPESHAESEAKKEKKKKGADDPVKQIPRLFQFLFVKNGLQEKEIDVAEDGFVKVKSIVAVYQEWTEEQVVEVLGNSHLYILKKDDAQDLVIKLKVEEKPSSSQGSHRMEERMEDSDWKETGKKESSGNRKNEDGPFDDRRARNSPRDGGPSQPGRGGGSSFLTPDKICQTLSWIFREGARKYRVPFQQGNSLYVKDILESFPNFYNTSENDIIVAVKTAGWKNTFILDSSNGPLMIRKSESRPDRERNMDPSRKGDFHLSKTMSFLLRHGAEKLRLPMLPGGFIYVDDLLNYNDLRGYSPEDVRRVVAENDKKRFYLAEDPETGRLKVRANQGHTFEVADLELEEITNADQFPNVIHGTYTQSWNSIKSQGLKRMGRNHIHFAPGEPGSDGVISGMRGSCDVLIYIDLQKALNDGIKFYRSANNVILSPGDEKGTLLPKYFANAVQRHPRMKLPL